MKKKLALLLAALCLLLALTGCGEKEQSVHVTLYNQSGHDITSVCITPASSDDWGENFLDETLADGNGVTIGLGTYKESEVPTEWNILVYGEENYILYETDVDEAISPATPAAGSWTTSRSISSSTKNTSGLPSTSTVSRSVRAML